MTLVTDPPSPATAERVLDAASIAADFPLLAHPTPSGGRIVFLDSAASAQKPVQVLDAIRDTYEHAYANVHRGVYRIAAEATTRFEAAREVVRRFVNARSPREVIFTRGTTEAVNLVAHSWGRANLGPGDIVLATELEHHSNLVPWQQVALQQGASIRYIPVDDDGVLQLDRLDELVAGGTLRLVTLAHVSNSLGTVNPVREVVQWAHAREALVMVDGAQAAPHRPVDVQALDCDFYAFSGHKLVGPTGAGALWGREEILAAMPPFQYGGEMIRRVDFEGTTFNDLPWKFEAGTPAIAEVVGMATAIGYLESIGLERIHQHERQLTATAYDALAEVPGLRIYGPPRGAERGGILSFAIQGVHPHDIATLLDARDVCIRAGHHCAQPLMRRMGISATARASIYLYNTVDDVERLVEGLHEVRRTFGLGQ